MSESNTNDRETARVEAFSDGVFAIAITLLILELRVPVPAQLGMGGLAQGLLKLWPSFVSFLLSFFFVLIAWINHHRLFTHIARIDGAFLLINGFLLLMITFLPFPTSLLAAYYGLPDSQLAVLVYSGTFFTVSIAYQMLWRYASHGGRLLKRSAKPELVRLITREYNFTFPLFLIAFLVGFVNDTASLAMVLVLLLYYAFAGFTATDQS